MPPWTHRSSPFPPASACKNCSRYRRASEPRPNGTRSMSLKSSSLRAIGSRLRSRAPGGTSPTLRVIRRGEIFALLGPNGAGKTTLIGIICGIVNPSEGGVRVDGHDIVVDYRAARSIVGLVPQELTTDAFETVWNTVCFSRGLFGKPADPAHIEKVLRDLSLWTRKDSKVMTLSGGMKRRLLIAKALS